MNGAGSQTLLGPRDPDPVAWVNAKGTAPFLLIGDHSGNLIPERLGDLGLGEADRERHIAWDIGVAMLGTLLAERLDAAFVRQRFSRLVVDCNRAADAPDAVAPVSDGTAVPGNRELSPADRAARFAEIHEPYQAAIAAELARRDAAGITTLLVSLHSFTPAMRDGRPRPWQVGILHHLGDLRLAGALLDALGGEPDLTVGDNEPYRMDGIDYTVPRHAYPAMRPYAEIEVRQDLIGDEAGCRAWADRLARLLPAAAARAGLIP